MERHPPEPRLPDGIDDDEYRRIRRLMRASVQKTWRSNQDVITGFDPWDIVDEAWISMAENNFASKGPFLPHALTVARNKAIDVQRRAEAKRRDRSLDTPAAESAAVSPGADVDFFRSEDQVEAIQTLVLWEEAIYESDVLSELHREVFVKVRIDGKSRAAVGRELDPPLTGQRVGQIVSEALIKLNAYVKNKGGGARGR